MPEYGMYQDLGVKGSENTYAKTKTAQSKSKTTFSYKNKMPPSGNLDRWVIRRGLGDTRDESGRLYFKRSQLRFCNKKINISKRNRSF
jgi:hypothetical protein